MSDKPYPPGQCYKCGAPDEHKWKWIAVQGRDPHGSRIIYAVMPCCEAQAHTEPVGMFSGYLHPAEHNAEHICKLHNDALELSS